MNDIEKIVRDLTLMLLYLSSWEEEPFKARRSWKNFRFEALDELAASGLVSDSKRAKSLYFTAEGERAARDLLARYGIEPES